MATIINDIGIVFPDGSAQSEALNIPSGLIIMWTGSIGNIPSGWFLCDGSNGTPDLRNKFLVSVGSVYSVNDTGGSANSIVSAHVHTANVDTSGEHFHTVSPTTHTHSSVSLSQAGTHSHTATISTINPVGDHLHPSTGFTTADGGSHQHQLGPTGPSGLAGGQHTHPLTITPSPGPHSHPALVRNETGWVEAPVNPNAYAPDAVSAPPSPSFDPVRTTTARTWSFTAPHSHSVSAPTNYVNSDPWDPDGSQFGNWHHHTLSLGQAGSHSHTFSGDLQTGTTEHSHDASISSVSTDGSHTHNGVTIDANDIPTTPAYDHEHSFTISPAGTTLNGNLPPYYALAFLMKE